MQKKLEVPPAVSLKKESPVTTDQIQAIAERLGDIAQLIQAADAWTSPSATNTKRTTTVRSRSSSAYPQ
ncbi:hypothetical protein [Streptomyces nodosus]|uniref:hypothetical protein n=1 Tax=Streptomyces nodosus TaxID=40318 RepID=UPI001185B1D1|nr:hypothetical protein [Streptomyces nodosus]MBB4794771.1 hypothetical protein [Streptomyces nodosus]